VPPGQSCAVVQPVSDSSRRGMDRWGIVSLDARGDADSPMVYFVEIALLLPLRRLCSTDCRYETKEEVQGRVLQSATTNQLPALPRRTRLATYLHGSQILINIGRARRADVGRRRKANILCHARQDGDFEIVCRLVSYLIGSLVWKLNHIVDIAASQLASATLELEHALIARVEHVFPHMTHRLEELAVHLMSFGCCDNIEVLLFVLL